MENAESLNNGRNTLRKAEKLRHKSLVDAVFTHGQSLYDFPLRLNYRALTAEELDRTFRNGAPGGIAPIQMMITVPKKKRRHAVDRVLMRRRIREAYRLNRNEFKQAVAGSDKYRTVSISFIYIHTENLDYATVERKMRRLLDKVTRRLGLNPQEADQ